MDRTEIEGLFAKMESVEASTLPDRWWDRSTFETLGVDHLAIMAVNLGMTLSEAKLSVFQAMSNMPPGRPVRVLHPPIESMEWTVLMENTRSSPHIFTFCPDGLLEHDGIGGQELCAPVVLLIYRAEPGTPGFW